MSAPELAVLALRNPITGIVGCCARATSGQATAPPSKLTKLRRLICLPGLRTRHRSGSDLHGERPRRCPLWVKSRHVQVQEAMSALPPKADMCGATRDVRFGPEAKDSR